MKDLFGNNFANVTNNELVGVARRNAEYTIRRSHYSKSIPSGKSHYFRLETAIVVYSIPANRNIGKFILGYNGQVWELTRLWAPDGHERNLLTRAISRTQRDLVAIEPTIQAIVSFADPNVGHDGIVYRAASWTYTGQSEEGRY